MLCLELWVGKLVALFHWLSQEEESSSWTLDSFVCCFDLVHPQLLYFGDTLSLMVIAINCSFGCKFAKRHWFGDLGGINMTWPYICVASAQVKLQPHQRARPTHLSSDCDFILPPLGQPIWMKYSRRVYRVMSSGGPSSQTRLSVYHHPRTVPPYQHLHTQHKPPCLLSPGTNRLTDLNQSPPCQNKACCSNH